MIKKNIFILLGKGSNNVEVCEYFLIIVVVRNCFYILYL